MKRILWLYLVFLFLVITHPLFSQGKLLTVEEIYLNPDFYPRLIENVQWYNNSKKFSFLKYDSAAYSNNIYEHDIKAGSNIELIAGEELISGNEKFKFSNYLWSPDHKYILFSGVERARALKSGGAFLIYDFKKKKITQVVDSKEEQQIFKFSPDSRKLGFVRGNNIFILDLSNGSEKQLTYDGNENIINGHFDWVYEEEFSIIDGWDWSPDSKKIAFWRLDQTNVPEIKITLYDSLYLNFLNQHYPKAGSSNSSVKIGVIQIDNEKIVWMDTGKEKDIYIPRIKFTTDGNLLSIQKLNRLQNHLELMFFDTNTGKGKTIIDEVRETWIDINDDLTFLNDRKHFIWSSDRDGYNHLYLYENTGKMLTQITKGQFDVDQLIAVADNKVYYTSRKRGRIYLDLYSINIDGTNSQLVTAPKGNHKVNIAPSGNYIIDQYSNSETLPKTYLITSSGKTVRELTNTKINPLKDYLLSPVKFFNFHTSDDVELDAFIIKPPDFDSTKRYPVLIDQYSGPGSKTVKDSWGGVDFLWEEMLAQKGFIIVGVDPRNMGGRGSGYKKLAYRNLGKWETNDLIETAKYLDSIPYINPKKIGIWGWSYGGYMSSFAILKGADYFNTAIAVAPVTHWKYYDDIYTERYMSLPQFNPKGYEESSPLNYVDNLKGNLLIIHGMADDNVHLQNSVELVKSLIAAQKQFQIMYYPDKEHSLIGTNTRINLFNLMTDYLIRNLKD